MTEGADPLLPRMRDLCVYKGWSNLISKHSVSKCHSPCVLSGPPVKVRPCMWKAGALGGESPRAEALTCRRVQGRSFV